MPEKSATELSNSDLLASLVGSSEAGRFRHLISEYPNLRQLANLNPAVLIDSGLPTDAVERLQAVFEVARRYGESEWQTGQPLNSSGDVYRHFKERLATEQVELFYAVLLNNQHRKIRDVLISKGTLNSTLVHPRDLFAQVIRYSAAAVVLVHNHPSGNPQPSPEDLKLTRRLRDVGELMGIAVLDHVIIGQGRYVSFVDDGYW